MVNQDTPLAIPGWVKRSSKGEIAKIVQGLQKIALLTTIPTALQASIITFFFYYCALNFSEEVEYIWSRAWTRGKVVYILTRYSGAVFLMLMTLGLFPIRWNEAGKPLLGDGKVELLQVGICLGGHLYVVAGTVAILLSETILAMRVYALYGGRKRIIVLSVILMLISAAGTQGLGVAYTGKPAESCIGKPCLIEDTSVPYQVTLPCSLASNTISVFGWVPASFVELIFLTLVLWKTRRLQDIRGEYGLVAYAKMPNSVDIISTMARDSKKYFIQSFSICFIGACLNVILVLINFRVRTSFSLFVPAALSNTFVTFAVAALSIIAPKLFISLRVEYYGPVGSLADQTQLSWDVMIPPGPEDQNTDSQNPRGSQRGEYSVVVDQEP